MEYTKTSCGNSCRRVLGVDAPACSLTAYKPHILILYEIIKRSDGIGPAAHTCHHSIRKPALLFKDLGSRLAADDSLEIVDMGLQADWYGIEVNKENTELLEKIDKAIDELKAEGFFDELEEKHLTKTEFDAEEAAE